MCMIGGSKQWFTAAELAELKLPGLSSVKRKINERAAEERWALKTDRTGMPLCRARSGRGGGSEYHVAVLPASVTAELARRGLIGGEASVPANDGGAPADQLWSWFDQQTEAVKAEAARKLTILQAVEALEASGHTRSSAIASAAAQADVAPSSVWAWFTLIAGAAVIDRLPRLAPQRQGGGKSAEVDDGAWLFLRSDYLRPEKPTFASCYERCAREYCAPRGIVLPSKKTLQRKLEREVPANVVISRRIGADALRGTIPYQDRSIADLHALELVNIDGHKWDVFVKWPDGRIARPMMVAIQDVYSRKFVAWRIDASESAVLTRLAFADLFKQYGIPKHCLMDNGRAFASKWITGGVANRFRFKVRKEEPLGLLTSLGIKIHWALPFRGSSKPIERAFRDLCDHGAKHPAFTGAYTGNKPDAKPENYGSAAVDLETFKRVAQMVMDAHNAREGRRTEACRGLKSSFDQAFAASYATAQIGKAGPEQLRMALLAADRVSTDRKNGSISLFNNRYWSPEMSALAGQKVVVRFDPDDLSREVHVYDLNDRYLVAARLQGKVGFLDATAAQGRAREEAELRRATKRQIELQQLLTAKQLVEMMPDEPDEPEVLEPSVIRPVRHQATALKPLSQVKAEPVPSIPDATASWASAMERMPPLRLVE